MADVPDVLRLSDELETRKLIARIGQLADEGDLGDYAACFTADANWEICPAPGTAASQDSIPPRRGHAEIRAGAQERRDAGLQGPGTRSRHMITPMVVDVDGDAAAATSCILFVVNVDGRNQIGYAGTYRDELRRTEQGWKVVRRIAIPN